MEEAKSSTMTAVKRNIQKLGTTDLRVECFCIKNGLPKQLQQDTNDVA